MHLRQRPASGQREEERTISGDDNLKGEQRVSKKILHVSVLIEGYLWAVDGLGMSRKWRLETGPAVKDEPGATWAAALPSRPETFIAAFVLSAYLSVAVEDDACIDEAQRGLAG